jgi:transcriptional regulator with XRE-family HTH domain
MSDTPGGVTQQDRHRLRFELRGARVRLGYSQRQVAEAMNWSLSKVVRIESGSVGISVTDLKALLDHYRISDSALVNDLLRIVVQPRLRQWWDEFRGNVSSQMLHYVELEDSASRMRTFHTQMIPGLLQSRKYAAAIMEGYGDDQEKIRTGVDLRALRQNVLDRSENSYSFVLDEAALLREIGDREVMQEQLVRLRELDTRTHLEITVYPFSAGVHPFLYDSFAILDVPVDQGEDRAESVVLRTGATRDTLIRSDGELIGRYIIAYEQLRAAAVPLAEWSR